MPRPLRPLLLSVSVATTFALVSAPASAHGPMGGGSEAIAGAAGELLALCGMWLVVVAAGLLFAILRWRGGHVVWLVLNILTLVIHGLLAALFVWVGFALDEEFFVLLAPLVLVIPQVVFTIKRRRTPGAAAS